MHNKSCHRNTREPLTPSAARAARSSCFEAGRQAGRQAGVSETHETKRCVSEAQKNEEAGDERR